ncbi:MAG TPA: purine-nucleoside phosphorylase [Acidimicrobiales bacterium]|nr:purine-nucleoside phosphorylase [Acidimicrobiales bacterium]
MTVPTPHIAAEAGEVADAVLLPGDPLRAQAIAERFLDGARCYNRVRNMLGFTGTYRGRRVSVQGGGMGMPSNAIYATELLRFYGVTTLVRVGSCGALQERMSLRDLVVATAAHTDSAMNRRALRGIDFAPAADFDLVATAVRLGRERGLTTHVGTILSSDAFYDSDPGLTPELIRHGVLAIEMEAAALYRIAMAEGARALVVAAVSDHITRAEALPAADRETGFMDVAQVALDTVVEAAPTP